MTNQEDVRTAVSHPGEASPTPGHYDDLDRLCVNTVRTLAMDAVQRANSGHPGMPMGTAEMAYVLWTRFLKHDPSNPDWPDRDRFVLSAGHGSMLLYSLLHLTGYDLPMGELMAFRQWGSRTPGHPEHGLTPGVETTTGPLGQGFAVGVGMAIAERVLADRFNRPGYPIVDHYTYAIVSDGDLMEGISHEAASLAGHLGLGRLIYLYDDNKITIDGSTDLTFSEDVGRRFEAYGWHVEQVDGHDMPAIESAIIAAQAEPSRPSLIMCRTHIAYGSPNKQDTSLAHGEPLGEEEVRLTKENLGWPPDAHFLVPETVRQRFGAARQRGAALEAKWRGLLANYEQDHPDLAAVWRQIMAGALPDGWDADVPRFRPQDGPIATRTASGKVLNSLAARLPTLLGGSGDLTGSNQTAIKGERSLVRNDFGGRYIHFGIREHGMGGILNGLALHRGIIPFGATFLVFSDYMRPSIRLAAMMELPVIYVLTHDSVGLGEDGPTHQPIEHLASLRAVPNLVVIRPADAMETAEAWRVAAEYRHGPVALVLTRQKLPILDRVILADAAGVRRGAYVLADAEGAQPDVILIATGSEVHVALEARGQLAGQGIAARVVSMPSWELFDRQPEDYRRQVLPPEVPRRVAIEAAASLGWHKYVGLQGEVIGLDRFGASAPYQTIMAKLGLSVENVVRRTLSLLGRSNGQNRTLDPIG